MVEVISRDVAVSIQIKKEQELNESWRDTHIDMYVYFCMSTHTHTHVAVLVDERFASVDDPSIVVAGDVCEFPDPLMSMIAACPQTTGE